VKKLKRLIKINVFTDFKNVYEDVTTSIHFPLHK